MTWHRWRASSQKEMRRQSKSAFDRNLGYYRKRLVNAKCRKKGRNGQACRVRLMGGPGQERVGGGG